MPNATELYQREKRRARGQGKRVFAGGASRAKAAKRGRPKLSTNKQKDGERLATALQRLNVTVSEAAQQSGVRLQWLSSVIAGTRALGREDLRALGRIGVPIDYVLGLTESMYSPGQSRTPAELAEDLRQEILARVHTADFDTRIRAMMDEQVDGFCLLDILAAHVRDAYEQNYEWFQHQALTAYLTKQVEEAGAAQREMNAKILLDYLRAVREVPPPRSEIFGKRPKVVV